MKKTYEKGNVVYQAEAGSEFEAYLMDNGFEEVRFKRETGRKDPGRDVKPQDKE